MIDQKIIEGLRRRGKKFADELHWAEEVNKGAGGNSLQQQELERLQAQLNRSNKDFLKISDEEKKKRIAKNRPISDRVAELKKQLSKTVSYILPNPPADDVPPGDDESASKVLREVGTKPKIKNPKDYLLTAEGLGIVDVKRAANVAGSRFGYLLGAAAQLEFALVQYAQKMLLKEDFTMVVPPVMVKEENMAAMGYLHGGGEDEVYYFKKDKLYLVGTSEQSIGPMHRDEIFYEADLPKRYLAFSTCFRREAGSYGKDTKGILRVHQFDKLEMFSFCLPDKSDKEHEYFLGLQEKLWQGLKIPYRVVKLCAGDLGWPSARTYDIEAWMPGQNQYREVASASTTTDYQSRDLNIKVKHSDKKELVHMLNGTAFAIGRTLIAIIENYQRPDGSVAIPKVLQPYMSGLKVIKKK